MISTSGLGSNATRPETATATTPLAWHDHTMPKSHIRLLGGRSVPSYDPTLGAKYTPNPRFDAARGVKLVKACQTSNINVTALLSILIDKMPVDEDGRPVWADEFIASQEGLPIDKTG